MKNQTIIKKMGSVLKNCMIISACFMPLKTVKKEVGNLDVEQRAYERIRNIAGFWTKGKMVRMDLVGIAVVWDSLRDVINQEGSLY
jgi:hypothetical protein